MPHDLLIKNGTVIDGSGPPGYRTDIAVRHGRIAAIGLIREAARESIDAPARPLRAAIVRSRQSRGNWSQRQTEEIMP